MSRLKGSKNKNKHENQETLAQTLEYEKKIYDLEIFDNKKNLLLKQPKAIH